MLLHQGRLDEALRINPGHSPIARKLHTSILLRLAEQSRRADTLITTLALRLAQLSKRDPDDSALAEQVERTLRDGSWALSREIESSGGVVAVNVETARPDLQSAQVRHAMAKHVGQALRLPDYLLSGYRRVRFSATEQHPVDVELVFRRPKVGYVPTPPLQVEVVVNQQKPILVLLDEPDQVKRLRLSLAARTHDLTVRVLNPYLGQYVFLSMDEIRGGTERTAWRDDDREDGKRYYHLATDEQPVTFRVTGPAWLRVERHVDGASETRELIHTDGQANLVLRPVEAAARTLYRIWELKPGTPRVEPPRFEPPTPQSQLAGRWLSWDFTSQGLLADSAVSPVSWERPLDTLLGTPLASPDDPAPGVPLHDSFRLGGQEDGTWGIGLRLHHRRPLEEGGNFGSNAGRFLQTALSHRKYDPVDRRYTATAGMLRFREHEWPYVWSCARTLVSHRSRVGALRSRMALRYAGAPPILQAPDRLSAVVRLPARPK